MKIYTRNDGFEVNDASDAKTIDQICIEFGGQVGDWTDVTQARAVALVASKAASDQDAIEKANAKQSAINKLKAIGLTDNEINALIGSL